MAHRWFHLRCRHRGCFPFPRPALPAVVLCSAWRAACCHSCAYLLLLIELGPRCCDESATDGEGSRRHCMRKTAWLPGRVLFKTFILEIVPSFLSAPAKEPVHHRTDMYKPMKLQLMMSSSGSSSLMCAAAAHSASSSSALQLHATAKVSAAPPGVFGPALLRGGSSSHCQAPGGSEMGMSGRFPLLHRQKAPPASSQSAPAVYPELQRRSATDVCHALGQPASHTD